MKIAYISSLYNESEFFEDTIHSVQSRHTVDFFVFLSGPRFVPQNIECVRRLRKYYNVTASHEPEFMNLPLIGTSKIIHNYYKNYDLVMVGSPDYRFIGDGFDQFCNQAIDNLDKYTISCVEFEGSNVRWACTVLTKKGIEAVGYMDPNFVPMGMSDNDYHARCLRLWSPDENMEYYQSHENYINAPYGKSIVVPSSHISYNKEYDLGKDIDGFFFKHNLDILNRAYYLSKWGGMPGKEEILPRFGNLKVSIEDIRNKKCNYAII